MAPTSRDRGLLQHLGARLRRLREDRGLTQEQVAARAGFTAKYLSECERGLRDLPLTSLRAIVEDGLSSSLARTVPRETGTGREPRSGFPRALVALCRQVAELAPGDRRAVMAVARAAVGLARKR
ncbi:MAG TPA: helix-turn-helix transcriptional regulator [Anaeromyxobacteraceae bacterium]|nr:helix-turn-helix transcriptional regulator [Anaeromyxobacteraceae bacterium]